MVAHVMDYTKKKLSYYDLYFSAPRGRGSPQNYHTHLKCTQVYRYYTCSNILWEQSEGLSVPSRGEVYML